MMQERVESGLTRSCIEHKSVERFVINTHAFHNAHLLRAVLPRSLVAPIPLFQNRSAKHIKIAEKLRSTQEVKRALAKARVEQKKRGPDESADNMNPASIKRRRFEPQEAEPGEVDHTESDNLETGLVGLEANLPMALSSEGLHSG